MKSGRLEGFAHRRKEHLRKGPTEGAFERQPTCHNRMVSPIRKRLIEFIRRMPLVGFAVGPFVQQIKQLWTAREVQRAGAHRRNPKRICPALA